MPHWLFHGVSTFLGSGELSKENERDLKGIREIEEKWKLDFKFHNPLLLLILNCIRMYDNYLHLVKIITVSEKSQAG